MKGWMVAVFSLALLNPLLAMASDCSPSGYTVIYVNGIFTTEAEAREDLSKLQKNFGNQLNSQNLIVRLGYNPSHLGGGGDLLQSVTQAFGTPVSNYDLNTILTQIHPQVTTRKILLLGHSQGSFYTDEMYQYLIEHGVPKESIAVYNVATPESFVAGGGGYLTSSNDKVINEVRDAENNGNLQVYLNSYYTHGQNVINSALRANTTLPKASNWDSDPHGGHYFSSVYLENAADRIVHDINGELGALKVSGGGDSPDGCFTPPKPTLTDNMQKLVLGVSDPLVGAASSATSDVGTGALALMRGAFGALASSADALQSALGIGTSNTGQVSAAALPFDGQLQGSLPSPVPPASPHTPAPVLTVRKGDSAPPSTSSVPPPAPESSPAPPIVPPFSGVSISPGFGGGGGGSSQVPTQSQSDSSQQNQNTTSVSLSIASPSDGAYLATTPVMFTGTADASAVVTAVLGTTTASTTTDMSGNWSLPIGLSEGVHQVDFTAVNGSGQSSATVSRTITIDFTAPATSTISVAACLASLLAEGCLVPTTALEVAWSGVADALYYGVAKNGVVGATTTALTSQIELVNGATTTITVISYDAAGNAATSTAVDVAATMQPLLINEIGWGGTDTDHASQWVEIKNNSPFTLDLSHIELVRSDAPPIPLSGTLPFSPNGSFLFIGPPINGLNAAHVLSQSFAPPLATTSAEQLSLVWNSSTTIDATPSALACTGWCAGVYDFTIGSSIQGIIPGASPLSMERKNNSPDGTLPGSWQSTDTYGSPSGSAVSALWGTPGGENSFGLPESGLYCGSPSNLLIPGSPPGPTFNPHFGGTCVVLSRFIATQLNAAQTNRSGGLFRGDITSSTGVGGPIFGDKFEQPINAQDPQPGEHFFYGIWENRSFANDNTVFNFYFTQGASSTQGISGPPHGNYVTIPFVYQP